MNAYLEKIASLTKEALNALKARQMAKKVGVIPDHDSAWKWALRNLRDGRGNPLQGKDLAQKRVRMGDLNNNAFQKVRSIERKYGETASVGAVTTGTEFYGNSSRTGAIERLHKGGISEIPAGYQGNLHTHPGHYSAINSRIADRISPGMNRYGYPNRIAKPSGNYGNPHIHGSSYLRDSSLAMARHDAAVAKHESLRQPFSSFREKVRAAEKKFGWDHPGLHKYRQQLKTMENDVAKSYERTQEEARNVQSGLRSKYPGSGGYPEADHAVFSKRPDETHRIVAPKVGVVSANKIGKSGLRTVYFQHS